MGSRRGGRVRLRERDSRGGALFSVYDRSGSVELARALAQAGVAIFATGGTRAHLNEHGVEARDVGELTGFPPLFDGRVKTLHPKVFGAILADRRNPLHRDEAARYEIPRLDYVVVNHYPFEKTVAKTGASLAEALEQIDIGGVALLRSAAKNFDNVTVVCDPAHYAEVAAALPEGVDLATRKRLATRAFERTAEYDSAIARYLEAGMVASELPGSLALTVPLAQPLRYGENPQQRAAFYLAREERLPEQLHGKALSYNNLLDLDACLRVLYRAAIPFPAGAEAGPAAPHRAAIVKHTVPCGVAENASVAEAVAAALGADPISAFGGIIAVDGTVDAATAETLGEFFLEIVAAPAFDEPALERLRRKKNLRIMRFRPQLPAELVTELEVRSALCGILAQDADPAATPERWHVAGKRAPTASEWRDLGFAWDVVRHVKSNGVVIVSERSARGICAGQTNRVSAVQIAAERAGERARGAACASDGFFPFADGLVAAADAGCTAVVAPSGSIRDAEVIAAADARGIALVFSTYRFFLH
ncbi:MAG: bifunctional phosphoribosylaminoimidazolecarboxamide formyltransferase/IMP cyclohydrolase [Candidatus Eremiobacteraeota bacterium]|nr:bifunctional phosphoribosylaminoimidazolecarboxamide formyltransferase/IMP cyclohydrolase [Candidatus Eremiobacteraeota bacterium]